MTGPYTAAQTPAQLRLPRAVALWAIAALIAAASAAAFSLSYRGLWLWARHHGLSGLWAATFPAQLDVFIAVGELALFVALVDQWDRRSRTGASCVTLAGLAMSVTGNVGHVAGHQISNRATAAVPPLAAASALAVGLGVLKRVVGAKTGEIPREAGPVIVEPPVPTVATSALQAAKLALAASVRGGNPLSGRALERQFGISRTDAAKLRAMPGRAFWAS